MHSHLHLPPLNCSIRKIADMLSADGYYTIVPKILNPCMDGSEEGDGEREKQHICVIVADDVCLVCPK